MPRTQSRRKKLNEKRRNLVLSVFSYVPVNTIQANIITGSGWKLHSAPPRSIPQILQCLNCQPGCGLGYLQPVGGSSGTRQDDCGRPWGWKKGSSILLTLCYSQSLYKTISISGQTLALYLTQFWGLHPALPLLVHFAASRGISTASLFGRVLIWRFQRPISPPAPSPGLDASPSPEGSWQCNIVPHSRGQEVGSLARILWMTWVLSPLTFPDPVAVNIHLVDGELHWAAMPGEQKWTSRHVQAGSISSPQEFIYGISRDLFPLSEYIIMQSIHLYIIPCKQGPI